MGQMMNAMNATDDINQETTIRYDPSEVNPNNGYVLSETYFPEEIIVSILSCVDSCTLHKSCIYVCRKWNDIIKKTVWKKKAECEKAHRFTNFRRFTRYPDAIYQGICCKDAYGRNLLKNPSGAEGFQHWKILVQGGNRWKTETPPVGVSGDNENGHKHAICFATSYETCSKIQLINLCEEGITPDVLDNYRPDINISENYAARWDCEGEYKLVVKLLDAEKADVDIFRFNKRQWTEIGWQEIKHTFTSYKKGVRYALFYHKGCDVRFWAGHYGTKMTNARLKVETVSTYLDNLKMSGDLK